MSNEEHLRILNRGVEHWNRWRSDNREIIPKLNGAELSGRDLSGADFVSVELTGAKLLGADLSYVDFSWADLRGANLSGANLSFASFTKSDLDGAKLNGARLNFANLDAVNFNEVDLTETDFSYVLMWGSSFTKVDLSSAKGLDTVDHKGPSSIGVDTMYRSKGDISRTFLRGTGIPDEFINNIPNLIEKGTRYHSCFISYATADQSFADRLHSDLQSNGVRCWFAPEEIKGGRKLHEQLPEAIGVHDKLLLILSENSIKSEWVKTEIHYARRYEVRENQRKLFPISIAPFEIIRDWQAFDADTGKDMAREVREYFIPDFSNWQDYDSYNKAFSRLLPDLEAGDEG